MIMKPEVVGFSQQINKHSNYGCLFNTAINESPLEENNMLKLLLD